MSGSAATGAPLGADLEAESPPTGEATRPPLLNLYASEADLERMATLLAETGRYQVLRRLERCPCYNQPDAAPKKWALYVDVETTGLDPDRDAIIEFAGVLFEYCPASGKIYRVEEAMVFYEDPQRPIPAKVTRLTGISDSDVAGKRLNEGAIRAQIQSASLVLAHNAYFDRRFLERRLPAFRDTHWACSLSEIPWDEEGFFSAKLEILVLQHCKAFHGAHRADGDCYAAIHVLTTPLPSGRTPFACLLENARKKTVRLSAVDSPYAAKDLLKDRSYHWSDGRGSRRKGWHVEVPEDRAAEEIAWLCNTVYGGRTDRYMLEQVTARTRHSDR